MASDRRRFALALALTLTVPILADGAPKKWEVPVPPTFQDPEKWLPVLTRLRDADLPYTEFVAATRTLSFFSDLTAKEMAYRSLIQLVDEGLPVSIQDQFVTGDLDPSDDVAFADAYHTYKLALNRERGMARWADNYEKALGSSTTPRFLFHQAIEAYAQGAHPKVEEQLNALLAQDLGPTGRSLTLKAARTLARSYFDQKKYAESFTIYETLLLKANPIQMTDWLEAAWDLYHLKRYPEALGMLYNLESAAAGDVVNLEKYTLRGMVYRKMCAYENAEQLIASFEREFGPTLEGIRLGKPLRNYPKLMDIDVPENHEFRSTQALLLGIRKEYPELKRLPAETRKTAQELLISETKLLLRKRHGMMDEALRRSASKLVLMNEHLKFMKFDVQRQRYNPDVVFRHVSAPPSIRVQEMPEEKLQLRWTQLGDFWRNERDRFHALLVNQCE